MAHRVANNGTNSK